MPRLCCCLQEIFAELQHMEPLERMRGGSDESEAYDPNAYDHDADLDTVVSEFDRAHGLQSHEDDSGDLSEPSDDDVKAWEELQPHLDEPILPGSTVTARQVAYALFKLKIDGTIHDKVFNSICKLVHILLPAGNHFPGCAPWRLSVALLHCVLRPPLPLLGHMLQFLAVDAFVRSGGVLRRGTSQILPWRLLESVRRHGLTVGKWAIHVRNAELSGVCSRIQVALSDQKGDARPEGERRRASHVPKLKVRVRMEGSSASQQVPRAQRRPVSTLPPRTPFQAQARPFGAFEKVCELSYCMGQC